MAVPHRLLIQGREAGEEDLLLDGGLHRRHRGGGEGARRLADLTQDVSQGIHELLAADHRQALAAARFDDGVEPAAGLAAAGIAEIDRPGPDTRLALHGGDVRGRVLAFLGLLAVADDDQERLPAAELRVELTGHRLPAQVEEGGLAALAGRSPSFLAEVPAAEVVDGLG